MSLEERMVSFAAAVGWELNANKEYVDSILVGLSMRETYHGVPICPCVFIPEEEENRKRVLVNNTCPCADAYSDVERQGHCHCNLFVDPNFKEMNK